MDKPFSLQRAEIELEPQPGTALKSVTQEDQCLDEFMAVVRKRIELEVQHLANLKQLRDSYDSSWKNSRIWPLISSFIDFCGNEISHLEEYISEATVCLDRIPDSPSPLQDGKDEFNAFEMPENLKLPYLEYSRCCELACSESSVWDLTQQPRTFASRFTHPLPENERAYRQAVVQQRQTAGLASKWYQDVFPEILENHQQRTESVKDILYKILTNQSLLASHLSSSSSTAIHDIRLFSSSNFIASHHEQMNQEKIHTLLKEVCYRNHAAGAKVVKPLFGTGIMKSVDLAEDILRQLKCTDPDLKHKPSMATLSDPLQLERWVHDAGVAAIEQSHVVLRRVFELTFSTAPPLLPVSSEEIASYSKGVPREKMDAFLKTRVPAARQATMSLVRNFVDQGFQHPEGEFYTHWYLTGNDGTRNLVRSLWRKWDIDGDCPFPRGVDRVWDDAQKHSKVVWKKTGEEYDRQSGKTRSPVQGPPSV